MSLQIPPVIRVESGRDTTLRIVTGSDPAAAKAMVVIRGIPDNVSLTAGTLFPSGVWALKASEAPSARVVAAGDGRQAVQITVSLVTLDGNYLGNASSRLEIAPGSASHVNMRATLPDAALPGEPEGPAGRDRPGAQPSLSQADMDKVFKLMDRGDKHLLEGKVAPARRFYQLASEMGWPEGAMAIARTYDADFLKRFTIIGGIEPDPALAKRWYETAREISLKPRELHGAAQR